LWIHNDDTIATRLTQVPQYQGKAKHIDIEHAFIWDEL
jgi:hypothetical protein